MSDYPNADWLWERCDDLQRRVNELEKQEEWLRTRITEITKSRDVLEEELGAYRGQLRD